MTAEKTRIALEGFSIALVFIFAGLGYYYQTKDWSFIYWLTVIAVVVIIIVVGFGLYEIAEQKLYQKAREAVIKSDDEVDGIDPDTPYDIFSCIEEETERLVKEWKKK